MRIDHDYIDAWRLMNAVKPYNYLRLWNLVSGIDLDRARRAPIDYARLGKRHKKGKGGARR